MRQGQQNRRGRGRSNNGSSNNHSNNNSSNNSNNNNSSNGRKPQNPLSRNYESSGPDVKIRGTAAQIAEKYLTLARDASSSGDIVMAENYLQHAEHYNRIIMAAQVQAATQHPNGGDYGMGMNGHHNHRMQADGITNNFGMMRDEPQPMIEQPRQQYQAQPQPQHQPQPQPPQQQTPLPGMEPQPEVAAAAPAAVASTDTPAADAGEQAASRAAPDADGRRRRRRYPAGSTAASRAAAAAASAEPAANGHNGTGNGLDNEGRPSDEALAN